MLVHADRAIDLAAAAKQIAERKMRLDRVAVDLRELEEHLDRLVLLLVQKVIEAAEIVRRKLADARAGRALAAASADDPSGPRSNRKQQEQKRQREVAHASSGVPSRGGCGSARASRSCLRVSRSLRWIRGHGASHATIPPASQPTTTAERISAPFGTLGCQK